jgi:NAD(P)-dependent dehydrogenase (short-subunit alcohol dehydrogenase family)
VHLPARRPSLRGAAGAIHPDRLRGVVRRSIPASGQRVAIWQGASDRWDALIAILLTSPFLLAKYAWPTLVDAGSGRFLTVASAHAVVASPFKAAYVSAKYGVLGLVKPLALEGAGASLP